MQSASIPNVLSTPGHLICIAARSLAKLSEARLRPLGFGVGQVPVLVALYEKRASTQRDLARVMKTEQPSMAQMLARMERDGLVRRDPDPSDGRSSRVALTPLARKHLPAACAQVLLGNSEALSGFTDEESACFLKLITRLIDNLDTLNNAHS